MVRAGEGAFLVEDFVAKSAVAIGWFAGEDLAAVSTKTQIEQLMRQTCPGYSKMQHAMNLGRPLDSSSMPKSETMRSPTILSPGLITLVA